MRTLNLVIAGLLAAPWAFGQEKQDDSIMADAAKPTEAPALKQRTCPVTGKAIQEDVFVEQDGLRVYFSSPECPAKFKESPGSYLPAVYKQIYPQTVQVKCLVSGDPVDATRSVDFTGTRISFCCDKCPKDFDADPAKYLAKMKAFSTTQVHCPVNGKAINPRVSTQLAAKMVYFSSKNALDTFKAAPTKYMEKLRPEIGMLAHGDIADGDLVLCAVVPSDKAVHHRKDVQTTVYRARTYFLCGDSDEKEFKANPATHAKEIDDKMKAQPVDADQWFTCTMHPDVLQKGPGKCPTCGMNLTQVKKTGAKNEQHLGHEMMQRQHGGGHGGMMRGRGGRMQGQGQGDQREGQQNGDHPGCGPLGHEH